MHLYWQDLLCLLLIYVVIVTHWRETHKSPPAPPDYLSSFTFHV